MVISSNLSLDNASTRTKLLQASAQRPTLGDFKNEPNGAILRSDVLTLIVEVVTAHFLKNIFVASDLSSLMEKVERALISLDVPAAFTAQHLVPAVPINESVTKEYIVCLEDGKKLKMLKGYLRRSFNLTPEQYRKRWGLPADYPMVAPDHALRRSLIAKKFGLGGKSNGRWKTANQMEVLDTSTDTFKRKLTMRPLQENKKAQKNQKNPGKGVLRKKKNGGKS
jgi:predicted transcriptional regulator